MAVPFWDLGTDGYDGPDYSEQPWDIIAFVVDQRLLRSPGIATVKCVPREKIDIQKPNGGDVGTIITRGHEPARVDIAIRVWTPTQWQLMQELIAALWRKSGGASRQDRVVAKSNKPQQVFFRTAQERLAVLANQTMPETIAVASPGHTLFFATPEARAEHDALVAKNAALNRRPATDAEITKAAAISISHPATDLFGVGAIVIESMESPDQGNDGTWVTKIKAVQYAPPSKKNVTRKREGAGKVAQVAEHQLSRNHAGPAVSATDGLPTPPRTPARGGT